MAMAATDQEIDVTSVDLTLGNQSILKGIDLAVRSGSGLRVEATSEIGQFYPATLRMWRERFLARADEVAALGFDVTFRRMWEFYLAYCEAGFRTGALGDVQLRLARQ